MHLRLTNYDKDNELCLFKKCLEKKNRISMKLITQGLYFRGGLCNFLPYI